MTTTVYTITDNAWASVGAGPCTVTIAKGTKNRAGAFHTGSTHKGMVHITGGAAPAAGSDAYHDLDEQFTYSGTETVYVQSVDGDLVVAVTPIA